MGLDIKLSSEQLVEYYPPRREKMNLLAELKV
jgi:hypothetical protein